MSNLKLVFPLCWNYTPLCLLFTKITLHTKHWGFYCLDLSWSGIWMFKDNGSLRNWEQTQSTWHKWSSWRYRLTEGNLSHIWNLQRIKEGILTFIWCVVLGLEFKSWNLSLIKLREFLTSNPVILIIFVLYLLVLSSTRSKFRFYTESVARNLFLSCIHINIVHYQTWY